MAFIDAKTRIKSLKHQHVKVNMRGGGGTFESVTKLFPFRAFDSIEFEIKGISFTFDSIESFALTRNADFLRYLNSSIVYTDLLESRWQRS